MERDPHRSTEILLLLPRRRSDQNRCPTPSNFYLQPITSNQNPTHRERTKNQDLWCAVAKSRNKTLIVTTANQHKPRQRKRDIYTAREGGRGRGIRVLSLSLFWVVWLVVVWGLGEDARELRENEWFGEVWPRSS